MCIYLCVEQKKEKSFFLWRFFSLFFVVLILLAIHHTFHLLINNAEPVEWETAKVEKEMTLPLKLRRKMFLSRLRSA
jgi:hypothetical protein